MMLEGISVLVEFCMFHSELVKKYFPFTLQPHALKTFQLTHWLKNLDFYNCLLQLPAKGASQERYLLTCW